jgi:hypothetical protein
MGKNHRLEKDIFSRVTIFQRRISVTAQKIGFKESVFSAKVI